MTCIMKTLLLEALLLCVKGEVFNKNFLIRMEDMSNTNKELTDTNRELIDTNRAQKQMLANLNTTIEHLKSTTEALNSTITAQDATIETLSTTLLMMQIIQNRELDNSFQKWLKGADE